VYLSSLPMLPLIKTDVYFFKTLIGTVFVFFTGLFTILFFMRVRNNYLQEGISAGIIWMIISLLIDIPIFVYGKLNLSFLNYFNDIGLTYVGIPLITITAGYLLEKKKTQE